MGDKGQSYSRTKVKKGNFLPLILLFFALFFTLCFLSFARPQWFVSTRIVIIDTIRPFLEAIGTMIHSVKENFVALTQFSSVKEDIQRLTKEKEDLLQWRHLALKLEAENSSLKDLLRFVPESKAFFLTSRVLLSDNTNGRILLIAKDPTQRMAKGNLVLGKKGVLGKIIEVGDKHARVMLINDSISRMPVRIEGKNIPGLVAGDYDGKLKLLYVPSAAPIAVNDRLITASDGDVVPAGYFVGTISTLNGDAISVTPASPLEAIDFVIVVLDSEER